MSTAPHIMFAGGGAAGQVFPGIAIASHLTELIPQANITFAGPGKSREKHSVRSAGYHYLVIPAQPLPRNPMQAIRFVTDNVAGYCAAKWMLREQRVSLVVGLGGYTSTAVVRAAAERAIPFILLEQNAIPSHTTRWLSRAAKMVCAAFEEIRPHLPVQAAVQVTGNPARPAFEKLFQRLNGSATLIAKDGIISGVDFGKQRQKRLVILGGSGGARSINESLPSALQQLKTDLSDWQIVHQTGEGQLQQTEARYRGTGVAALAVTYIDEIASVLFASDLVICRSSGATLAELAIAGVPAVLIPYAQAPEDRQLANAKVFATAKAARIIHEDSHPGSLEKTLVRELKPLLVDETLRRTMADNMRSFARPHASADIAAVIHEVLYGVRSRRLAA